MMKILTRSLLLISVLPLFWPQYSYACSCVYVGGFTEYAEGQTVVKGKVIGYGAKLTHGQTFYETMTVKVENLIQGTFNHSKVEFIGDPGNLCLTYVDSDAYPVGSEHLFIMFSTDRKQGLGGCGEVSVSINNGVIKGRKLDAKDNLIKYSMDYDDFIKRLGKLDAPRERKAWWKFW